MPPPAETNIGFSAMTGKHTGFSVQLRQLSCLLLMLMLPVTGFSESSALTLTNELAKQKNPLLLLHYMEMMEDPGGNLALDDVVADKTAFKPPPLIKGQMDLFLTHSAYWFKFDIDNQSDKDDWYFNLTGSLSRKLQVYLSKEAGNGLFVEQSLMDNARTLQYHLNLESEERYRLYFRVQDLNAPLAIDPHLRSPRQMLFDMAIMFPLFSFAIGGLFTLAAYNLLYFFYLRDKSFLALSVFIVGFVMELGNHSGLWFYFSFFRQYMTGFGSAFGLLATAAAISLAGSWLETEKYLPRMHKIFQGAFWSSLALIPLQWWFGYGTAIGGIMCLLLLIPFIITTVLRYREGFQFSVMPRIGIWLVIIAFIPSLLRGIGLIGDVPLLIDSMYFVLLIALLMLSLTQAEQVRTKGEQAERILVTNEAKDKFLTTMSHELRTPMNAVVSAGRLLRYTPLKGVQKEYVARLNTSSEHMLVLINDILDLARLDSHSLDVETIPFRLEQSLQQLEQLLNEQARDKKINLILDNHFYPLNKQLQGDPTRLQQVLLNLLNNAIKFTAQGEVHLTIVPQDVTADSACLLFTVRDTGIGIAEDKQKQLFQPFSQLDSSTARKYGGSGLGLVISQKLVQRMGGELLLDSTPGEGSSFSFVLSFALKESVAEPAETSSPAALSLPEGLRFLLVDDDEMNRFFGRKLIGKLGVEVEVAEGAEEAIQLLKEKPFDLVFMDVSMPDIDGYEATRRIRTDSSLSDLLIIALTAHAITGERERCLAAGMDDYLSKPFKLDDVRQILHKHYYKKGASQF